MPAFVVQFEKRLLWRCEEYSVVL